MTATTSRSTSEPRPERRGLYHPVVARAPRSAQHAEAPDIQYLSDPTLIRHSPGACTLDCGRAIHPVVGLRAYGRVSLYIATETERRVSAQSSGRGILVEASRATTLTTVQPQPPWMPPCAMAASTFSVALSVCRVTTTRYPPTARFLPPDGGYAVVTFQFWPGHVVDPFGARPPRPPRAAFLRLGVCRPGWRPRLQYECRGSPWSSTLPWTLGYLWAYNNLGLGLG